MDLLSEPFAKVCKDKGLSYKVKKKQFDVLQRLINQENVVAVLPTGSGKSVLYALLPALLDEVRTFPE